MMSTAEEQVILLVDDEPLVIGVLEATLRAAGYDVASTGSPLGAIGLLNARPFRALVTDISMPEMSGLDLLAEARRIDPDLPVILMTGHAEIGMAIAAVKKGAFDFITKPFDFDYFTLTVGRAVRHRTAIQLQRDYKSALEEMVRVRTLKLTESMNELRIAKERAENALMMKSRFISTMRHEIRTPANGIVGMIDLALEAENREDRESYLGYAREAALKLNRVMDGILTYSHICGASPEAEPGPFSPRDECGRIARDMAEECSQKGLECIWNVSDDIPSRVVGDRNGFVEILRHLTGNAVKFTPSGSVFVDVSVQFQAEGAILLAIAVADSGIGVPDEWRTRIFEPFSQVDDSLTRPYDGTGLGLAIVKRYAQLAGGETWMEPRPGGGSVFHCTLWVREDTAGQP